MIQPPSEAVVPIFMVVSGIGDGDGEGEGEAGGKGGGDTAGFDVAGAPAGPAVAATGVAVAAGSAIDGTLPQPTMNITDKSRHRSVLCTPGS